MARVYRRAAKMRPLTLIEQRARCPNRIFFSDYPVHPQDDGVDLTEWTHPDSLLERSITNFLEIVSKGVSGAADADYTAINAAMGFGRSKRMPHRTLCSHAKVRALAKRTLWEVVRAAWSGPPGIRRRWMMITAITDLGNSVEDHPVVEMHRVKEQARKVVADLGLNAIMILETQAAVRHPGGGQGGTLMTHVHGIAYTDDPALNLENAAATACARPILSNWLGAPTFHLKPIETKGELNRACYYLNKFSFRSSRLVRDRTKPSGYRTAHQTIEVSSALRLAELLSLLEYKDIAFGTGAGVKLKGKWLRALRIAHRKRADPFDDDLEAAWMGFWSGKSRGRTRHPFDLRWDAKQPPSDDWERAMESWHASEQQRFDNAGRSDRSVRRVRANSGGNSRRLRPDPATR